MTYLDQVKEAKDFLLKTYSKPLDTAIILGTGLGRIGDEIQVIHEFSYDDIPHFPISTLESHHGKLIVGRWAGRLVLAMKGRFHYYEGYSMREVTFPIRVLGFLGVKTLLVSNACGGLDPAHEVGDVMLINDQIDLFPENALRGKNPPEFGPRFPDMSEPFSLDLLEKARSISKELDLKVHEGVYAGVQGPNLETKAEYAYLRKIGADAVGMSTVPEVMVANQMGMRVFGISAITDLGVAGKIKKLTLEEVLAGAEVASPKIIQIIRGLLSNL